MRKGYRPSRQTGSITELIIFGCLAYRSVWLKLTYQNPHNRIAGKKNPTIIGRAFNSSARNILSVGVCSAPAIPVRKATIKNAAAVMSNIFEGVVAVFACLCITAIKELREIPHFNKS